LPTPNWESHKSLETANMMRKMEKTSRSKARRVSKIKRRNPSTKEVRPGKIPRTIRKDRASTLDLGWAHVGKSGKGNKWGKKKMDSLGLSSGSALRKLMVAQGCPTCSIRRRGKSEEQFGKLIDWETGYLSWGARGMKDATRRGKGTILLLSTSEVANGRR